MKKLVKNMKKREKIRNFIKIKKKSVMRSSLFCIVLDRFPT